MTKKKLVLDAEVAEINADWILDADGRAEQISIHEALSETLDKGGPGSGHHGHEGRPGKVGGSKPSDGGGQANLDDPVDIDKSEMEYEDFRAWARTMDADDTIRVYHGTDSRSAAKFLEEGVAADAPWAKRVFPGEVSPDNGIFVSPERRTSGTFGRTILVMDVKIADLEGMELWGPGTEGQDKDEFWRNVHPDSAKPALTESLLLAESQAIFKDFLPANRIIGVWEQDPDTVEWQFWSREEAMENGTIFMAPVEKTLTKQVDPAIIDQMVERYGRIDVDRLLVTDNFVGWIAPDGTIIELPEGLDWASSAEDLRSAFGFTPDEVSGPEFFNVMLNAGFAAIGFSLLAGLLAGVFLSDTPTPVLGVFGDILNRRPTTDVEINIPDQQIITRSLQDFERVTDFQVLNFESDLDQYRNTVKREARRGWSGQVRAAQFEADLLGNVELGLERAWTTALRDCGMSRDEASEEERDVLRNEIIEASNAFDGFYQFLVNNPPADVNWESANLQRRIRLWENRYRAVYSATRAVACGDKKFKWVWSPEKEHCSDCAHLHGRVHRASVWYKWDVYPQHPLLECGGWECGCRFEETDEPAWPGRPPKLTGVI